MSNSYNDYMHATLAVSNTTMRISEDTKRALLKVGAEYTLKDGKDRSLEEIVKLLLDEHSRKSTKISSC